ncbi:hypothetical protein FZEAL_10155 [Fusarium zealandicum]|uniref:Uncharacterized protein n=1 Tax=Fusarium zealandicum TaxID=1053134 RepID=A0A8H4XCA5_9HYPO|nr:hypothetical protein FZEAL_10155 [Fusarium zealandicum]
MLPNLSTRSHTATTTLPDIPSPYHDTLPACCAKDAQRTKQSSRVWPWELLPAKNPSKWTINPLEDLVQIFKEMNKSRAFTLDDVKTDLAHRIEERGLEQLDRLSVADSKAHFKSMVNRQNGPSLPARATQQAHNDRLTTALVNKHAAEADVQQAQKAKDAVERLEAELGVYLDAMSGTAVADDWVSVAAARCKQDRDQLPGKLEEAQLTLSNVANAYDEAMDGLKATKQVLSKQREEQLKADVHQEQLKEVLRSKRVLLVMTELGGKDFAFFEKHSNGILDAYEAHRPGLLTAYDKYAIGLSGALTNERTGPIIGDDET